VPPTSDAERWSGPSRPGPWFGPWFGPWSGLWSGPWSGLWFGQSAAGKDTRTTSAWSPNASDARTVASGHAPVAAEPSLPEPAHAPSPGTVADAAHAPVPSLPLLLLLLLASRLPLGARQSSKETLRGHFCRPPLRSDAARADVGSCRWATTVVAFAKAGPRSSTCTHLARGKPGEGTCAYRRSSARASHGYLALGNR
jgi:hypothetical protein